MTRKFKSTITDWVAIKGKSGLEDVLRYYKLYNAQGEFKGIISFKMVEKSNEWEEITEKPILVTEDGVKVYDGNEEICVLNLHVMRIVRRLANECTESDCKYFYHKENAEAYIEREKPKYSDEDLNHISREVNEAIDSYYTEHKIKEYIMAAIETLKNSKND